MLYNPNNPIDKEKATRKFNKLIDGSELFELTEKKTRTDRQNNYLHLILSWFALDYGETLEYIKDEFFKRMNADIFEYERINPKTGEKRKAFRSSANLTTGEMSTCIDRFRNWSSKECDIYLPEANEHEFLKAVQAEISRNQQWL